MSFSNTFKNIIQHIDTDGDVSQPRDLKVKESILSNFVINPKQPIADFPQRNFNWKYLAGEMAWYLKQDRDVDYIGNFSNFWSRITNPDTNEINSNYGSLVFNKEQFGWVIDSLEQDKNSRQAIMFFNSPKFQFEGNKDFVCTMYANFFIRHNILHMKVQMRSNDIFYGLTFDAPFFAFLQQSVYLKLKETYPDLELGMYYHYADNLHFYERHFELADQIKAEDIDITKESTFMLKQPFLEYDGKNVTLSNLAQTFVNEIDASVDDDSITSKQDYKDILDKYFVTNGE
jgi:thymidylate synthase|tara:strand:+ start:543 stop:1406 length:864 start_codon:yes stop_codon:yes gene_type:complete